MKGEEQDTYYEVVLGPVKVKDGLFIGDQLAAKDIQFIISNKVTHIINTVAFSIGNLWEKFGIHYLSVNWTQSETNIFDIGDEAVNTIYAFIQETTDKGQTCLVHSINGKTRASVIIIVYLMKKYNWSLAKTMQFVESRKQGLLIRPNFRRQLQFLEQRWLEKKQLSDNWHSANSEEEKVLNNTYKNSTFFHEEYYQLPPQFYNRVKNKRQEKRVVWKSPMIGYPQNQQTNRHPKAAQLKPILKEQLQKQADKNIYFDINDGSEFDSSNRNLSDSFEKLLFESTRRNIKYYSDEEEERKCNNPQHYLKQENRQYFKRSPNDSCYLESFSQSIQVENQDKDKNRLGNPGYVFNKGGSQIAERPQDNNKSEQIKNLKRIRHYDRVMTCYQKMKSQNMFESAHIFESNKNSDLKDAGLVRQKILYSCESEVLAPKGIWPKKTPKSKSRKHQITDSCEDKPIKRHNKSHSQKALGKGKGKQKNRRINSAQKIKGEQKPMKYFKSKWHLKLQKRDQYVLH